MTRAFTLIEVLIATIILGLGVLGLAALFAGAASQQQSAAEVTRAVAFTQGGVAILENQLGRLRDVSGGTTSLPRGTWDALAADERFGQLTSRLALTRNREMFFEIDATEAVLFLQSHTNPQGGAVTTGPMIRDVELPHGRVPPESVVVNVLVGAPGPIMGGGGGTPFRIDNNDQTIQNYLDGLDTMPEYVFLYPGGNNLSGNYPQAGPGAVHPNPAVQWVLFRTGYSGGNARVEATNVTVGDPPNHYIGRISVNAYKWLDDFLVSASDRIVYINSDTVPGGRLPVMSYAAVYRETPDGGAAEATIFAYAMRPLAAVRNRRDELPYLPPETMNDIQSGDGVLREVRVTLGFDPNSNQYYIVPGDQETSWIADSGQILLMSSRTGVGNSPDAGPPQAPNRLGADTTVRVRTQRRVGGELRGILSDSPRFLSGASPLTDRQTRAEIFVWGVQPIVASRSSDRTQWSLRPVDARTIKLVQN